jgi:hypothetical protein
VRFDRDSGPQNRPGSNAKNAASKRHTKISVLPGMEHNSAKSSAKRHFFLRLGLILTLVRNPNYKDPVKAGPKPDYPI